MLYIFTKYAENPKAISHYFLQEVLYLACDIKDAEKKLKKLSGGKPYVEDAVFSLSHSQNAVCVAVASQKAQLTISDVQVVAIKTQAQPHSIGVDIESVFDKKPERCSRIAQQKFFKSENQLLNKAYTSDYTSQFCAMWTKKESYSKYTGVGLKDALAFDTTKAYDDVCFYSNVVELDGKNYALCVCYNAE